MNFVYKDRYIELSFIVKHRLAAASGCGQRSWRARHVIISILYPLVLTVTVQPVGHFPFTDRLRIYSKVKK